MKISINDLNIATDQEQSLGFNLAENAGFVFSLKKIVDATKVIRIQNSVTLAETDIGFSGNSIDQSAITAAVPTGIAYVLRIYNQLDDTDYLESTQGSKYRIATDGVIETLNGSPAIRAMINEHPNFQSTRSLSSTASVLQVGGFVTWQSTACLSNTAGNKYFGVTQSAPNALSQNSIGSEFTIYVNGSEVVDNRPSIRAAAFGAQAIFLHTGMDLSTWTEINTGYLASATFSPHEYIQELIIWDVVNDDNADLINTDANNRFTTY